MDIKLTFPKYKLFEYEKELAFRELEIATSCEGEIIKGQSGASFTLASDKIDDVLERLKKLTYFEKINFDEQEVFTYQAELEKSCPKSGTSKRQTTRYGAHGLHEYKGKFNPQIVSSIIQIFNLPDNSIILEPFCGSGTTLYESSIKNHTAIGFDFNPLAVYLANTKLSSTDIGIERAIFFEVINVSRLNFQDTEIASDERGEYLKKWFENEQLLKIETLLNNTYLHIQNEQQRDTLLCIASNLIREYSLQEPADLRIRRRKTELPAVCLYTVLEDKVNEFFNSVESVRRTSPFISSKKSGESKAYNIDIRDTEGLQPFFSKFDAAITSPPYATALPYIDTQRLSLIWLKFASPKEVKKLENALIGSRELTKAEERQLREMLLHNENSIPEELHKLCLTMLNSLNEGDGFRRQAVPFLIYRYFADMKIMFENVSKMMKKGAPFALVVGHNQTTLGGVKFDLNTPAYLSEIAENNGWKVREIISLDVYHRYDLHSSNSINHESLVILENQ
ncbi:hypothetical protein NBRC116592_04180 [Colwellia sp. KU-HH00111]|uniref:DNA methyltransferase n=1 Tax=Colwellia sp. KU-HH00111 TaxID=3127652 RepID=UPI00310495AC